VYTCGYEETASGVIIKYWKNGIAIDLNNGALYAGTGLMSVFGSDVYVAGYEYNGTVNVAKYWKNGTSVNLTNGTKFASARGIFVVQH